MAEGVVARPWTVLTSKITYADRWLRIRTDDVRTGRGDVIADFHILEYPDWINVIAVQDDGQLLLAREYRHGVGQVVLGLISGGVEIVDGDLGLDGLEASARRELYEETGFVVETLTPVLTCYANSARHNNLVTTFIARGLEKVAEPNFEVGEEVELVAMDPNELFKALGEGSIIMQAVHLAGLYAAWHAKLIG
ncbi:MAG: NUDIX hydrolase [Alphaproteobacteria bacterium]